MGKICLLCEFRTASKFFFLFLIGFQKFLHISCVYDKKTFIHKKKSCKSYNMIFYIIQKKQKQKQKKNILKFYIFRDFNHLFILINFLLVLSFPIVTLKSCVAQILISICIIIIFVFYRCTLTFLLCQIFTEKIIFYVYLCILYHSNVIQGPHYS